MHLKKVHFFVNNTIYYLFIYKKVIDDFLDDIDSSDKYVLNVSY